MTNDRLTYIALGLFVISFSTNLVQEFTIQKLKYTIQRLETGPWKSILEPQEKTKIISDDKMRELINKMLDQMFDEQRRKNII